MQLIPRGPLPVGYGDTDPTLLHLHGGHIMDDGVQVGYFLLSFPLLLIVVIVEVVEVVVEVKVLFESNLRIFFEHLSPAQRNPLLLHV